MKRPTTKIEIEYIDGSEMTPAEFDDLLELLATFLQHDLESSPISRDDPKNDKKHNEDLTSSTEV